MTSAANRALSVLALLCWAAVVAAWVLALVTGVWTYAPMFAVPGYGTVGGLLAVRRPTNPIGWLLLATASVPLLVLVFEPSVELQNGIVVAGLALVLVLFPTGSPPSRMWLVPMVLVVASWLAVGRVGVISLSDDLDVDVSVGVAVASLLACAAAPVARFRRAEGLQRVQLRWLGAAVGLAILGVLALAAGLVLTFDPLQGLAGTVAAAAVAFGIPGSMLVAILRYRLYDIGRIVSRTVTYSVVAVAVSTVYSIPVLVAPRILGSSSDVVTAGATLAAFTAFSPLRRRVRVVIDRRFDRPAYDAALLVEHFSDGLRDEVDTTAITARFADSVDRALHPRSMAMWLRRVD